jgi:hypothetical protein
MRWAGNVARTEEKRNAYRLLAGKPEGKRPLAKPRRTWLDNIKIDLGEIGWSGVSECELYRPSDRRLSANVVVSFADRGMPRSQRGGSPTAVIALF